MRVALLAILAAVLLIVAIATWGSLGSAVCVYGLIMMAAALIHQHFLTNRSDDDFTDE